MSIADYKQNPALRPTILVHEALKNVYRPSEAVSMRAEGSETPPPRESSRAA